MVNVLAATEITIEKAWNLVDWLIVHFGFGVEASVAANVLGALACILVSYLLGSVNPAILFSKRMYHEDIRAVGSGSADSLDMFRVYGKKAGVLTLLCELAKAAIAVWAGRLLWEVNGGALAGFFVLFGHMFPIWHRLRGGKGLMCLAMVVLTVSQLTFLILLFIFLVCLFGTKMLSFATVMTALLYPMILQAFAPYGLNVAMAVIAACFMAYMHRGNLKLIQAGKEEKLDFSGLFHKKNPKD
ncbi:MAG: glycerol-3-phosphate acyltransferase [Clostridia bacterium]|nr:glycerol-3-phosphate acyltransferase [Clostridia bacterium]